MNWTEQVEKAIQRPQLRTGDAMPKPIMVEDFGVYLGAHFDPASRSNMNGHPMWHVSISMHSNPGYRVGEWAEPYRFSACQLAEKILRYCGEGEVWQVPPGAGVSLNFRRAMSGREIDAARANLPERKTG